MNSKYMFIVAVMAVMLIGATALATEDAFAGKKKYGKSQASKRLWQRILARECGMSKHCISDSGRRERGSHSSRPSIPIRHT